MELQFSHYLNEDQVFKFEEGNETFITSQLTLMDPLDRRNIYISNSTINGMVCGDGIFAKKNIPGNWRKLNTFFSLTRNAIKL